MCKQRRRDGILERGAEGGRGEGRGEKGEKGGKEISVEESTQLKKVHCVLVDESRHLSKQWGE